MYYSRCTTDLCDMILIGDEEGLKRLHLVVEDSPRLLNIEDTWIRNDELFLEAVQQLKAYARGELKSFQIKLNPEGTAFQKKVWSALATIDYGQTVSYKDIAIQIGNENASRAVGMANGKNPIPIIVPCHRVIGSSGKMTGFAFGIEIKRRMIEMETFND